MKNCHSDLPLFLRYYSEFLAADNNIKNIGVGATASMSHDYRHTVNKLIVEIMALRNENKADGYLLYLLGLLCVKSEQYDLAVETLLESLHKVPINWDAWMVLGDLIVDRVKVINFYENIKKLFIYFIQLYTK